MSNLSDILDTYVPPQTQDNPVPINAYPLLGLMLILLSTALTCVGAYHFLVGW